MNSGGCRLKGGPFIPKAAADRRLPGLIYCYGFPGSDKSSQKIAEDLSRDNYVSVWFYYKGVRENEGELNFVSQVDDLKTTVDYLESREEIGDKIVVVGHCLRMHSDSDSFFSSKDSKDGAIRLTLNWLKKNI